MYPNKSTLHAAKWFACPISKVAQLQRLSPRPLVLVLHTSAHTQGKLRTFFGDNNEWREMGGRGLRGTIEGRGLGVCSGTYSYSRHRLPCCCYVDHKYGRAKERKRERPENTSRHHHRWSAKTPPPPSSFLYMYGTVAYESTSLPAFLGP